MTQARFSREQLEQRIAAFQRYAQEHHLQVTYLGLVRGQSRAYLVEDAHQYLEIIFTTQGGVKLSGDEPEGMALKLLLLPWMDQEGLRYQQWEMSQQARWLAASRHPPVSIEKQEPTGKDNDALLTCKEAQGYLRIGRSTLYRLMWSGQLTGHKVGNTWRFYREDLRTCVRSASPSRGGPL